MRRLFWILSNRPKSFENRFSFKNSKYGGNHLFFSELSSNIIHLNWLSLIFVDFVGFFSWESHQCRPCQVMMVINNASIRPYFLRFWHWGVAMTNDVTSDSFYSFKPTKICGDKIGQPSPPPDIWRWCWRDPPSLYVLETQKSSFSRTVEILVGFKDHGVYDKKV